VANKTILFQDNFSKDPVGKFPAKWISNRPGEIVTLKNTLGKWLKLHSEGTYLPVISQDFTKNFAVEFDFIHQANGGGNNTVELTLFSRTPSAENDALFPGNAGVKIVFETFIVSCLCYDNMDPKTKISAENRSKLIQPNNVAKIKIEVENQQLKVFVNGFESLNVPNCNFNNEMYNAVRFYLWGSLAEPLIGNIAIDAGAIGERGGTAGPFDEACAAGQRIILDAVGETAVVVSHHAVVWQWHFHDADRFARTGHVDPGRSVPAILNEQLRGEPGAVGQAPAATPAQGSRARCRTCPRHAGRRHSAGASEHKRPSRQPAAR
jgi:hypothetical protein